MATRRQSFLIAHRLPCSPCSILLYGVWRHNHTENFTSYCCLQMGFRAVWEGNQMVLCNSIYKWIFRVKLRTLGLLGSAEVRENFKNLSTQNPAIVWCDLIWHRRVTSIPSHVGLIFRRCKQYASVNEWATVKLAKETTGINLPVIMRPQRWWTRMQRSLIPQRSNC